MANRQLKHPIHMSKFEPGFRGATGMVPRALTNFTFESMTNSARGFSCLPGLFCAEPCPPGTRCGRNTCSSGSADVAFLSRPAPADRSAEQFA